MAIDEAWLHNYVLSNQVAMVIEQKKELPKVEYVAAENSYSAEELRWYFGISTAQLNGQMVAVIPVFGSLTRGWAGDTSTEWVSQQLRIAEENVAVVATVLRFSTPGGSINGSAAFGRAVKMCKKPVLGYVENICASAGLLPAAQCREVWIESKMTTGMGSLGVMITYISVARKMEAEMYDVKVLRSEGSEDKNLLNPNEPLDPKALAEEQILVNKMRVEMLKDIRAGRPQISESVSGKMFYGSEAIKAGFADKVGYLDDVIKRAFYLGSNF